MFVEPIYRKLHQPGAAHRGPCAQIRYPSVGGLKKRGAFGLLEKRVSALNQLRMRWF